MTPLMWALRRGRLDAARTLLMCGADPARRAPDGRTLIELVGAEHRSDAEALLRDANVSRSPNG